MLRVKAQAGRLLEGREPRRLRRRALAPGAQSGTREAIDYELPADPAVARPLDAAHQGHRAQPAHAHVRHRRHRRRRADDAATAPRSPTARPASGSSSRTLRRGDTYTASTSTRRSRPSASCAAAGTDYDRDLDGFRDDRSSTTDAGPSPARRSARRDACDFPEWDAAAPPRRGHAPRLADRRPRAASTATQALERSDLRRTWALSQRLKRGARQPVRLRQVGRGLPRPRLHLHRGAAGHGAHARGLPVRRQVGLLPAVLGRDGAAAADGRHPGARGDRLHVGLATTARPRSTSCATSTPTPGSRRGSPTIGWVTFDPTPSAAPPRSQSDDARQRRRSATRPTSAAAARSTRAPARPRPRARRWELDRRRRRRSALLLLGGGVARVPPPRPPAPRRCPSSSARCAARAARPGPGATLQALEDVVRPLARRRRPTCARCATSATAAAASAPTRAQRRGLRSELGRGGGLLGRLRAWWALPPRPSMPPRGGVQSMPMAELYDLFQRGTAAARGRRLQRRHRPARQGPRPRSRQGLDPRGARPRVLPLAPVRGRAGRVRGARRARADQRLRALLPRPLAARAGPSEGRAQGPRAGRRTASGPARLPHLQGPRTGRRIGLPVL